jgi:hypothetical protein
MLIPDKYLYCTVVGYRLHDDVDCFECPARGPIVIVDLKNGEQADVCPECLVKIGQLEKEDFDRRLHVAIEKFCSTHSDARKVRPELLAEDEPQNAEL